MRLSFFGEGGKGGGGRVIDGLRERKGFEGHMHVSDFCLWVGTYLVRNVDCGGADDVVKEILLRRVNAMLCYAVV